MAQTLVVYLGLLFIGALFANWADKCNSKFLLFAIIVIYALIVGLRGESVGYDTLNYIHIMDGSVGGSSTSEIGVSLLLNILSEKGLGYNSLFLFYSFGTYLFLLLRLWDYRKKASFSMMVFMMGLTMLLPSMNIIRQMLAMSIVFYATRYICSQRYILFLLFILLGAIFHLSSFVGLLFFVTELLRWNQLKKKTKVLFCIGSLIFVFIGITVLSKLYFTRFSLYFETSESNLGFLVLAKMIMIILIYALTSSKKIVGLEKLSDPKLFSFKLVYYISLMGLCIHVIGYYYAQMGRIGFYLEIFDIVFYSIIYKAGSSSQKLLAGLAIVILYFFPFLNNIISTTSTYSPYLFYWQ